MRSLIKQKKGQAGGLLMWVLIMAVVIMGSIVLVIGSGILTFTSRTLNDVTTGLGVVGDTNLSHASDVSIGVVNSVIQNLQWASGVILFFALLGILMMAVSIRLNPNGFMIGLFLFSVVALIFMAIIISNNYEQFLNGNDEIATELRSMTMATFMVLYLPHIITALAFVGGIIIFTGIGEEGI